MKIGGFQKFSLIDYPGEICAIVFTTGCNFKCPYCHNPELVEGDAADIRTAEVMDFLERRTGKLSAVSITGGEPTLHKDLSDFIKAIKSFGYKVKLDTNGTKPDMLAKIIDEHLVDYIAMDVKAPFEKYGYVVRTNCDTKIISESIEIIMKSGVEYEFRTTAVSGLTTQQDILRIAETLKGARAYYLQRFIPSKTLDKGYMNKNTLQEKEFEQIKDKINGFFEVFSIR